MVRRPRDVEQTMKTITLAALAATMWAGLATAQDSVNQQTGVVYPGVSGGSINQGTGEFYPNAGSGSINPNTGQFYPGVGAYQNPSQMNDDE